jgi:two-component system cell cycle sensor histidine kinase/response regulator CckA
MSPHQTRKLWLPYCIAMLGIMLSLFAWHLLKRNLEISYPWVDLIFGIGISILVAIIIGFAHIASRRALFLRRINEDLKNEIAERINVEETKQKLEIALSQGQKLQAIGTLAGGIAHDFNNILYAIIGYVEMAREDVPKNSITYKNLGKVMDATHRGQELIARILAFSRRQHHRFDALNLTHTIEAVLALLRSTIPTSVMIQFEPVVAKVCGNQTQIHQVLVNIINNAVDAMDGEGIIRIRMTHIPAGSPLLKQFPEILPQNYCKIDITDNGHGMDRPTLERIFEPFFTTKEVGKGTGLGLSIVHSIIKEHQGKISVQSQLGHGTSFMILLPEV